MSLSRVITCPLCSCVNTRTSAGDKLPPVGGNRYQRSVDDGGSLKNWLSNYSNTNMHSEQTELKDRKLHLIYNININ
jgi:hypothetical protein